LEQERSKGSQAEEHLKSLSDTHSKIQTEISSLQSQLDQERTHTTQLEKRLGDLNSQFSRLDTASLTNGSLLPHVDIPQNNGKLSTD